MLVITFNVNGIRARIHQLDALVQKYSPDIICLQEIKVSDEDFPYTTIEELGYKVFNYGQKGFHGVAILCKEEPLNVIKGLDGGIDEEQKRFIQCDFNSKIGTISICNSYFPQGENRKHELKFPYKERYYKRITEHLKKINNSYIVTGDFNIAPLAVDRAIGPEAEKRWLREGHTAFLPEEIEWFSNLTDIGIEDIWRTNNPNENISTWFDYRSRGFEREPKRGLRIDFFLTNLDLRDTYVDSKIDHEIRAMDKPSDHCPVTLKLDI
jgi:exodeoxyribonuclease-3